ncbi:MAG: thioredoxin [Methanolinea sp. SDB]|nr:MAG: thioredoxin [Methanolinea sp. SDB]
MDDEELDRIREKKILELQRTLEQKNLPGVVEVNQATFSRFVEGNSFAVLDFWAEWCGPCRMVGPIIEELSHEFAGIVTFGKCNTDLSPRLATQYGISAIPTVLFFANGRMVDRVIGAYPKDALRSRVIRAFGIEE